MIYILEGLNGVGKSACAKYLSKHMGLPIVRPFRGADSDTHLGHEDDHEDDHYVLSRLRDHGVPVNTFVDDIYTADFLVSTGIHAVLDRSIASAIAYGLVNKEIESVHEANQLLELWQSIIIKRVDVLYVNMTARRNVRKARCKGRWYPTKGVDAELEKWFTRVFGNVTSPKITLDTSDAPSPKDGATRILKWRPPHA